MGIEKKFEFKKWKLTQKQTIKYNLIEFTN